MAGELIDLVAQDQLGRVTTAIHEAIEKSFITDLAVSGLEQGRCVGFLTQSETKRRFNICLRIFRTCRGDLKWSIARCCDNLHRYLREELDGKTWEPDARLIWSPS